MSGNVLQHGYVNGEWHKQPIALGYSGVVRYLSSNDNLSVGNIDIYGLNCPIGQIWTIEMVAFYYAGTPPTSCRIELSENSYYPVLLAVLTPTSGLHYVTMCNITIKSGERLRLRVRGASLGDTAYLLYSGKLTYIDR